MSRISKEITEFDKAVENFVVCFEIVFDNDWDLTQSNVSSEYMIKKSGTFLEPGVEDESNNWANRGSLLASYRRLRKLLDKE